MNLKNFSLAALTAAFILCLVGSLMAGSGSVNRLNTDVATAEALSSNPADCAANQFAQSIAADGDLTCAAVVDADVPNDITVTLAATATALASNPTDCASNQYANAIAASGNLTCGAISDADVPNTLTLDSAVITQANLSVGSCTANQIRVDTGGAVVEFCICTATNTWSCAALATGPAD